jgi:hypothetical protein
VRNSAGQATQNQERCRVLEGIPELAVFRPPSLALEGEVEVGVEGMEDGLWGMDTGPMCSSCSTGSAYLPPVTTGEVGGERAALPGVMKVPGGYAPPAILTGTPLSFASGGTGLSTGRGSTTGIGTVVNQDNARY